MILRSVAVLGGGPGGLYAARLLKLRHPEAHVVVHEQGVAGQTFGFGVGLAARTQRNLEAADPQTLHDIVEASWSHDMSMSVDGRQVRLPGDTLLAIGRATLLDILRDHAVRAGVEVRDGTRVSVEELEVSEADLVIAADGVGSATRDRYAAELGASVETDHGWYLWAGTDVALPSAVFSPAHTDAGTFVTHAYPYAADRSTFLVETDEATWRRAGFDATTAATADLEPHESDEASLAYLSEAFAEQLGGHRLIGNRTRWTQFRTVRCDRWHLGRTVLLGDAAHTAHYSIGSGTKLAMEDAIVLDRTLAESDDVETALERYEQERRPAVEHLQATARRSMHWWHTFPQRLDLAVEQLFISYMSRAGKVGVERFAQIAPEVVRTGLAAYAGAPAPSDPASGGLDEWVVGQPFTREGWGTADRVLDQAPGSLLTLDVDVPQAWGDEAGFLVERVRTAVADGYVGVVLTCADDTDAVLTMLETAERVRLETGAVVVARTAARHREHLVAALASGRVDLIDPVEPVPDPTEEAA